MVIYCLYLYGCKVTWVIFPVCAEVSCPVSVILGWMLSVHEVGGAAMKLSGAGEDALLAWVERSRNRPAPRRGGVLRFAFYGRVSTEDYRDPVTSRVR